MRRQSNPKSGLEHGEAGRLPVPVTGFVGRRRELAEAGHLLAGARLMTLTGPAGVGKTRLALELAAPVAQREMVWFVEIASLRGNRAPARALAAAMGLAEGDEAQELLRRLRERSGLVVLDNCEHLVNACATLVEALLAGCPGLRVLSTSREPLGLPGEVVWTVPGLELPPTNPPPRAARLLRYDAVLLLRERAGQRRPDMPVDESRAQVAAQICWRLDGNPLAIELAAARVAHLPLEEIMRRLEDRFRLLRSPTRAGIPRHRTLQAAVDWSYQHLEDSERTLFRRLSVFRGSFGLDAVSATCGVGPDSLDEVARLVDKSLVVALGTSRTPRYRLLETLRDYARGRLREAGEEDEVRARHAAWFLTLAEGDVPKLYGPLAAPTLERFEVEHDNFRAALDWALGKDPAVATRLGSTLGQFWILRGYLSEGRDRLKRCLEIVGRSGGPPFALLLAAGNLALRQDDFAASRRHLERAVAVARVAGDRAAEARAHDLLGRGALEAGNFEEADSELAVALGLYRELESTGGEARVHWHLTLVAACRGDYDMSRAHILRMQALCESIRDPWGMGLSHLALAYLGLACGDCDAAALELLPALQMLSPLGEPWSLASTLRVAAGLAIERGATEQGLVLMGAANQLDAASGARATRVLEPFMVRWQQLAAKATPPETVRAALGRGQRLSLAEAIDFALDVVKSRDARHWPAAGLTRREVEVARLMASGASDREIGGRLGISVRTVEKHAENVRSKLGLRARSELVSAHTT